MPLETEQVSFSSPESFLHREPHQTGDSGGGEESRRTGGQEGRTMGRKGDRRTRGQGNRRARGQDESRTGGH